MLSMSAKLLQLCLTLHNPLDCSPVGSSVHRILQARILEWNAMPSSRRSSRRRDQTHISWLAGRFFTTEPPGKPSQVVMDSNITLYDLLAEPGSTSVVANTACCVHINPSGEVETDRRSSHGQVVISCTPAKSGAPGWGLFPGEVWVWLS